jgi:hypothetical protein
MYAITGTRCSLLAVYAQISEKTVFMELFAPLDQADAAKSIPAEALDLDVGEADPGGGKEGYFPLEITPWLGREGSFFSPCLLIRSKVDAK